MKNKKGFTLIELMIVVAIIAILAMIAVPMYQRYIERARNNAAQAMLSQMAIAQISRSTTGADFVYDDDDTSMSALMDNGFRPDPNIGVEIGSVQTTLSASTSGGGTTSSTTEAFVMFAAHKAVGSTVFVYDNATGSGVTEWDEASATATAEFSGLTVYKIDTADPTTCAADTSITINVLQGKVVN